MSDPTSLKSYYPEAPFPGTEEDRLAPRSTMHKQLDAWRVINSHLNKKYGPDAEDEWKKEKDPEKALYDAGNV
ncbi:hypothetical protein O6P43_013960 [Quillaja saponaria]|uniref:Uncharacterized protein n=1 Tax=Quillaja saponaria TaxID=32244 RepID=A0AAD7PRE0_QUISA|nr:hypothetical protein O6P43_013960 [Quillaja saponaria]